MASFYVTLVSTLPHINTTNISEYFRLNGIITGIVNSVKTDFPSPANTTELFFYSLVYRSDYDVFYFRTACLLSYIWLWHQQNSLIILYLKTSPRYVLRNFTHLSLQHITNEKSIEKYINLNLDNIYIGIVLSFWDSTIFL